MKITKSQLKHIIKEELAAVSEDILPRQYYWSCVEHDKLHQPADNMADAQEQLEAHEREEHKGKQVGSFGYEVVRGGETPMEDI